MLALIKFILGFLLCLLVFSLTTSLLSNMINFNKISIRGFHDALSIFIMFSPSTFGYYCLHYLLQYKKKKWNKNKVFILLYIGLALVYTFVFGFVIPIIGLIGTKNHSVEQFIGLAIASAVTYLVLKGSFDQK